jgi:hypothetical protein
MAMNDFIGLSCADTYGTFWLGPLTISWQSSLGQYAYAPHRQWGNVLVIFKGREFLIH